MLVDVQNMYHSAKHLFGARVNFKEVLGAAVASRSLVRSIAYVVRSEIEEEKAFFDALIKAGFELKMKDLQIFPGGVKKADWDVGIAVDAIRLAGLIDALVLITGDGDFVPLVEYLQANNGLQVEVMAFGKSASSRLREAANDFLDLGQEPKRFLYSLPRMRISRAPTRR